MKITEIVLGTLNVTNFILSVPIRKKTLESYTNVRYLKTEEQKNRSFVVGIILNNCNFFKLFFSVSATVKRVLGTRQATTRQILVELTPHGVIY